MSWKEHIENINEKVNKRLNMSGQCMCVQREGASL